MQRAATSMWNASTSSLMREFRQYPLLRKTQHDNNVVNNNIKMLCSAAEYASMLPDFHYHSDDEMIERHGVWFQSAHMRDSSVHGNDEGWWFKGGYNNPKDAHEFAKSMSCATGRDFQVWYNWADLPYVIPIIAGGGTQMTGTLREIEMRQSHESKNLN